MQSLLPFYESWDHCNAGSNYGNDPGSYQGKWNIASNANHWSTGAGGITGNCLGIGSCVWAKYFDTNYQTIYSLVHHLPAYFDNTPLIWYDGDTIQYYLKWVQADQTFKVYRGDNTLLGTVSGTYPNAWHHIGLKVKVHNSTGTVDVWIDNVNRLSLTGVDTQNTANAYANRFVIGAPTGDFYWLDNLILYDGSSGESYIGEYIVDCDMPVGAGNYSQWTPTAGSNYQCVDEVTPNLTDYNFANELNKKDSFIYPELTNVSSIHGVQHVYHALKASASDRRMKDLVRYGGSDYLGDENPLTMAYAPYIKTRLTNPGTGVAWTQSSYNASEHGYDLTT